MKRKSQNPVDFDSNVKSSNYQQLQIDHFKKNDMINFEDLE